jgi:serine/threonine protein kinase
MIGEALSHYRILEELGAGGMGVVFRARDTKLGRDVAIKVLSPKLAQDGDRFARFEREARLLASLNHPHIATLYGFEQEGDVRFLVMELVEGETLASKIASGPLPVREALRLFHQIAQGLEAAHEKGIVHRDLKPSNIKITDAGQVKVLDFGLAKPLADGGERGSPSESPTMTRTGTASGVILGTAAYMSPEQARGKALDKRTDVWSFACCLFEALAGRAPFSGDTVSDIVARVLEREPDWEKLPRRTPARIRDLLEKCLSKDARERLHDIADARIEISRVLAAPDESEKTGDGRSRSAALLAVGAATAVTLISLWNLIGGTAPSERLVTRSFLELPEGSTITGGTIGNSVAISPDGRFVVYIAGEEGRLYVQSLEANEPRSVEGSEGATVAFFSADSEWVGFASEGALMRAAVSGGAPNRIAAVSGGPRGVDWGREGLVFAGEVSTDSRCRRGAPRADGADSARRENLIGFRSALLGQGVLFTIATNDGVLGRRFIAVLSSTRKVPGRPRRRLSRAVQHDRPSRLRAGWISSR